MTLKLKLYLIVLTLIIAVFVIPTITLASQSGLDLWICRNDPIDNSILFYGIKYNHFGIESGSGWFMNPLFYTFGFNALPGNNCTVRSNEQFDYTGTDILAFFDTSRGSQLYVGIGKYDVGYYSLVYDNDHNVLYFPHNSYKKITKYGFSIGTRCYLTKWFALSFGYHTIRGYNASVALSFF